MNEIVNKFLLVGDKFKKRKVHSAFIDSIWGADLADMQFISKFDKRISFFYYMLWMFSINAHGLLPKDLLEP